MRCASIHDRSVETSWSVWDLTFDERWQRNDTRLSLTSRCSTNIQHINGQFTPPDSMPLNRQVAPQWRRATCDQYYFECVHAPADCRQFNSHRQSCRAAYCLAVWTGYKSVNTQQHHAHQYTYVQRARHNSVETPIKISSAIFVLPGVTRLSHILLWCFCV